MTTSRSRRVGEELEADGALPRDDLLVVIGMDEDQAFALRHLAGEHRGAVDAVALQQHPRAEALGALHLVEGRALGHDDGGGNGEALGVIGDALGMIAGGHGDDAGLGLLRRQAAQLVAGAAVLERAGELLVLQLQRRSRPHRWRRPAAAPKRPACAPHGRRWSSAAARMSSMVTVISGFRRSWRGDRSVRVSTTLSHHSEHTADRASEREDRDSGARADCPTVRRRS